MNAYQEQCPGRINYDAELRRHDDVLRRACAIQSRDHVLDIGCGTGHTSRQAARATGSDIALGVDISAPTIEQARALTQAEQVRNVAFECADAQVYAFAEARFHLALSRCVQRRSVLPTRIGYDDLPGYLDGGMDAWINAGLPAECTDKLTMRDLRERLERGDPLLVLDVRQAHEWRTGHRPAAKLHEAGDLPHNALELPPDRTIAVHCGHGERAPTAVSVLERRGCSNLALVTGGIDDWRHAGGEIQRGDVKLRR